MANFYLDPVNGNDANDGTTWANAWKTFTSGPTAARLTPGDTIRVAKTPDATSVGSSTWTDNQIGASIVFGSAIAKDIDRCKAGWVTMGSGSTVTNAQTTAWVTMDTDNVGKALQWVTSASANGAYKDLGSTIDFSGYQQVCFWFRVSGTFDCTSTQNLLIDLCSDAGATTVVTALSAPKISYAATTWYPIVIDFGAALSSTVRSVRIRTTNTTTLTFQIDEMFASPASGVTLRSVLAPGSTSPDFYPIRTIRGTDVHLMARFSPSTAAGACGTNCVGAAWRGTTGTYTAYKREPQYFPTQFFNAWPGNIENGTITGTVESPYTVSGGWDTSTTVQNGETWIDGLAQNVSGFSFANSSFHNYWRIENMGFVRTGSCTFSSTGNMFTNLSFVATGGFSYGSACWNFVGSARPVPQSIKCYHGNSSGVTISGPSLTNGYAIGTYTIGNCWGNGGSSFGALSFQEVTIGDVSNADSSTSNSVGNSAYRAIMTFSKLQTVKSTQAPTGLPNQYCLSSWNPTDSVCNVGYCENNGSGFFAGWGGGSNNSVFNIGTQVGGVALCGSIPNEVIFNNTTLGASSVLASTANSAIPNYKLYFHNYGGVNGASRIYVSTGSGNNAAYGMFELQGTDVYTSGSKAWKYSISGIPALNGSNSSTVGCVNDIKLAAVAAEANKLVTITCRVKRSTTTQEVGIKVSGKYKLLPGYTDDVKTVCSSSGSFELLTVTFTPTADCVFDVMAHVKFTDVTSLDAVWDDLHISQAA